MQIIYIFRQRRKLYLLLIINPEVDAVTTPEEMGNTRSRAFHYLSNISRGKFQNLRKPLDHQSV